MDTAATAAPSAFARFTSGLRTALRLGLNVALPPLCPSCRTLVAENGLCPECWGKLAFIAPPYCPRLGIPFVYDPGPGILSMQAIADPPAYDRARAAVRFDDISRTLVHALKYGDRLDLAPTLGRWMARAGHEILADTDALVPVPLHWRRLWARRFNQSGALAAAISNASGGSRRAGGAQTREADAAAGRALAQGTRRQRAGRVPCRQGGGRRAAVDAGG